MEQDFRKLVNPVDPYSGAGLASSLHVDNIIVFNRTSTEMMRPREISHNYHRRFVLVIPIEQTGDVHVEGVSYLLKPGVAHLIFPYQFHHFLDTRKGDLKWLFITFDCRESRAIESLRNSTRVVNDAAAALIKQVLHEYVSRGSGVFGGLELVYMVSCLLRVLLSSPESDSMSRSARDEADSRGELLREVNRYVRENLHRPLSITDVAEHTGYSASYLRAVFRKELGVSLGSYMRDSRLSVAAAMLSDLSQHSVEETAKACGFTSIFTFSRAFKKAMGVSPSVYGKLHAEDERDSAGNLGSGAPDVRGPAVRS